MSSMIKAILNGPLMTFGFAELAMKMCCCIATLATFKRITDDQEIPKIFMCLPSLLVLLLVLQKYTTLRDDPTTLGMVTGALVGVVSGFLSAMDKLVQADVPDQLSIAEGPDPVYNLELLHIPVVVGAVMYSFTMVFEKLPSPHKLRLAATVAMVGAVIATTLRGMVQNDAQTGGDHVRTFAISLLGFFLVGLTPSVQAPQQAWVLATVIWLAQLFWQSGFFDTLVWDWNLCKFPIPGCLTGLIVIYYGDVIVSRQGAAGRLQATKRGLLAKDPMEPMSNCFLWHAITFVVQRISLYVIDARKTQGPYTPKYSHDASSSCLLSVFFLYVMSNYLPSSPVTKVTIVTLSLALYVSTGLSNMALPNGLFIDVLLGHTVIYTVQMANLDHK